MSVKLANADRDLIYNFLSRAYRKEVDRRYLEATLPILPRIKELANESDNELLKKGEEILSNFLEGIDWDAKAMDELLLDLARDFCYFFLIGVESVPHSESVYLSPDHLEKQEPRDEVLELYRQVGFQISEDFKEPEDHIALELEFMARLSHLIMVALDADNYEDANVLIDTRKRFMEEHLVKWVPAFCKFLGEAAQKKGSPFYEGIAYLTSGLINEDYESTKEHDAIAAS